MNKEKEFLDLIEVHKGIMYKISRMYTQDETTREDLFQEILYQLWRSFDSFKKESQFSTWMYRVALNTAITFYKKEQKHPPHLSLDQALLKVTEQEESTRITLFYQAVQQLTKVEKAVVFLYLENNTHKEIGRQLGLSEGNARVRLNRAKNKLKAVLKMDAYEP